MLGTMCGVIIGNLIYDSIRIAYIDNCLNKFLEKRWFE